MSTPYITVNSSKAYWKSIAEATLVPVFTFIHCNWSHSSVHHLTCESDRNSVVLMDCGVSDNRENYYSSGVQSTFVVPCAGRPVCVRPTSLSPQGTRVQSLSSDWPQTPQACQRSGYEGKEYGQVERELRQSSPPIQRWDNGGVIYWNKVAALWIHIPKITWFQRKEVKDAWPVCLWTLWFPGSSVVPQWAKTDVSASWQFYRRRGRSWHTMTTCRHTRCCQDGLWPQRASWRLGPRPRSPSRRCRRLWRARGPPALTRLGHRERYASTHTNKHIQDKDTLTHWGGKTHASTSWKHVTIRTNRLVPHSIIVIVLHVLLNDHLKCCDQNRL